MTTADSEAPSKLDEVFHALSDPTRRAMLRRLESGPLSVGDLMLHYDRSLPAALKHLKVLEAAGLARSSKQGRVRVVSARPENMREAYVWMEHFSRFWGDALESFARYVESDNSC